MKVEFPSVVEYLRYRIIGSTPRGGGVLIWGRCLEHQGLLQDVGSSHDQGDAAKEV
jgi:hypothetical protein